MNSTLRFCHKASVLIHNLSYFLRNMVGFQTFHIFNSIDFALNFLFNFFFVFWFYESLKMQNFRSKSQ